MASSSPVSEPGCSLEENNDPSVSTTDDQTGKPTTKNKNTVNQKKTTPYEDPESVAPSGKTDADGKEESEVPISTDEQMKNEIDIDSTQPDSQQQQQGALDESSPGSDSPNNSDRGQHPLRSPNAASQDKGSQEHTASKNDPKEDGHTDIKSDDPVHEDEESVNDEVAKLLKENEVLKKQVQTKQDKIYEKDADIKSYNKVIDKKVAEAERQNCKIQQLEEDLTKKDDEIKSLKELQDDANCRMKQLEQDLNKKDDDIDSLKTIIIMLEGDVKKHAHYSEELEKKKQIVEEVYEAKMKQVFSQQNEIENLRCEKNALTESHKQLKSDNQALTEFQKRLNTYISDTKKKTDATTNKLEQRIQQLENDLGREKERRKKDIESKDKLIKKEHDQQQKVINEWKIKNQRLQDTYQKEFDRLSQFEAAYYSAVQDFNNQEKSIQTQLSTIKRQQSVIDRYRNENESKRQMISSLEVEKDNLLLRLSKITGAQLTYNNPNIADLSDDKRPTKLAEEFSELYDNEWTDAFECIEAEGDDRKTRVLYDLLKKSYEFCEALSIGHDKAIRNSFTTLNYTKSLSEVAHDGNIPNSSNESRSSSTDKKNENETQSSMDAANDDVKNDGGVHKQYVFIENASTHQQAANSEILNGDNIVTEAEKNKKKQQNENFEEKENDKTNSKEQQTTYARILDGANNVTNPYKNEVGESKTDEEMKIDMDSTTSKLQESTGPLILDGISGDTNAGENQEKQQNETGEGNEKDKTARTPQYGTNSGSLNEVNDVTIASKNDKAGESKNNEEKEMIATTSTHQESTDPGILDGANNVTIASGEEKELDDNRSPPQQGTVSEILDGVNHVNKTHKKEEEQQKTGEENVKDKNTSTPQDGTDSGSLNEINNVTIVSKNDKAGESKNNEENEKIETTSTHQESTDPGILDGVNNVTIASGGEKEFDDNSSPPQQGTISGILDGVNNVNITHKNEEEEQKTGVENVKNPITSTPQKGIESGISEGVNQVTNADTIENEVPRKISGRKKHDANKSPPQEDTDTDFLGGDNNNTKSDRNKRKQNAEGTLVVNKEQIKVSELTLDFDDLSAEQKKTIMDLRKLCEERQADDVVQVGSKLIATEMQIENCEITKYISKCIDICWSMRRHTPPVYMDYSKSEEGLPFDKQKYRPYTKSGKFVHFVVWPVLYLHEGGPQLSKGVAQGIN